MGTRLSHLACVSYVQESDNRRVAHHRASTAIAYSIYSSSVNGNQEGNRLMEMVADQFVTEFVI